ncbi:MAG: hypothetical protein WCF84_16180 [Anaerolineae bacterium]
MAGPFYRVRQLVAALRARPLDEREWQLVGETLPAPGVDLYRAMPLGDQRHSLTILKGLLAQGYTARPLAQAALLHDVAKSKVGLLPRSVVIVANALSPFLLPRLALADPRNPDGPPPSGWRYPFYLSLHHPELGAEAAERAGLDPRAVILIRRHQTHLPPASGPESDLDDWQRALKQLDDQN